MCIFSFLREGNAVAVKRLKFRAQFRNLPVNGGRRIIYRERFAVTVTWCVNVGKRAFCPGSFLLFSGITTDACCRKRVLWAVAPDVGRLLSRERVPREIGRKTSTPESGDVTVCTREYESRTRQSADSFGIASNPRSYLIQRSQSSRWDFRLIILGLVDCFKLRQACAR